MKMISSLDNPLIKKITSLHQKKYRDQQQLYLVEGYKNVRDIVESENAGSMIFQICLSSEQQQLLNEKPFSAFSEKVVVIDSKLVKHISDTKNSSGVLAMIHKQTFFPETILPASTRILVLDKISDPGNAGTIIRTALAAKFEAVIVLKGTVDIYSPKVVRSAMGAVIHMPFLFYDDFETVADTLRQFGFTLIGADLDGDYTLYDLPAFQKVALIMGSEDMGVTLGPELYDYSVTIPMDQRAESLNVAVASGILMYGLNKERFGVVKK